MKARKIVSIASILFAITLFFLASCGQPKPKIVGRWKLEEIILEGTKISGQELNYPIYTFQKEGNYSILAAGVEESGTWTKEQQTIKLTQTKPKQEEIILRVDSLSQEILIYTITNKDVPLQFTLHRAENAEEEKD